MITTFSEVVDEIQGDEMKAMGFLTDVAEEQRQRAFEIRRLNDQLNAENAHYNARMKTIEHVCKHIKKEPPFTIIQDGKIYQVNDTYQIHISTVDFQLQTKDRY